MPGSGLDLMYKRNTLPPPEMEIHLFVLRPFACSFEQCVPFQNPHGEQHVILCSFGRVKKLMKEVSYSVWTRCSAGSFDCLKIDELLISNNIRESYRKS